MIIPLRINLRSWSFSSLYKPPSRFCRGHSINANKNRYQDSRFVFNEIRDSWSSSIRIPCIREQWGFDMTLGILSNWHKQEMSHITSTSPLLPYSFLLFLIGFSLCLELFISLHFCVMGYFQCLSLLLIHLFITTFFFSAIFTRSAFSFTPSKGSFSSYIKRQSQIIQPSGDKSTLHCHQLQGHQNRMY